MNSSSKAANSSDLVSDFSASSRPYLIAVMAAYFYSCMKLCMYMFLFFVR